MFSGLRPAQFAVNDLTRLAEGVMEVQHHEPVHKDASDEAKNLPAGYTYVGQFIDHDLVLDRTPLSLTPVDLSTLTNFRTPQLDLDSVYGGGPAVSPQLYRADGIRFRIGAPLTGAASDPGAADLKRDSVTGRALVGDPRNDENRIIASLHSIVTRYHNKLVDHYKAQGLSGAEAFRQAKQQVIWHYQWAILTDFLRTMTGGPQIDAVAKREAAGWKTTLKLYNPCLGMPIEFSGAAYRFGHSMVRDDYDINQFVGEVPIFANSTNPRASLAGFTPSPTDFAIDWNLFFSIGGSTPQNAYRIDNSLVPELRLLPLPAIDGVGPTILAQRNLLRGQQVGLPTGQDVARALGLKPLRDDQIAIGPATGDAVTVPISSISPAFVGAAPLWTYVLAESVEVATDVKNGIVPLKAGNFRLGPVGSRIVNETIVGLMVADPNSVINNPGFKPSFGNAKDKFGFRELIAYATS